MWEGTRREIIGVVEPAERPGSVAGRGVHGLVARPALFARLEEPARVTVVSAPAGSGKTALLRSWIARAGLVGQAACVTVGRGERDPQRFWLSVIRALRGTAPAVRPLHGAPPSLHWQPSQPEPLREPLSGSEIRVLRYLPTNLSAPEIAHELSVSTNTIKSHIRSVYTKLGAHRRADAVESARTLGLLAPVSRGAAG